MPGEDLDYDRLLLLYSAGADSTLLMVREPTARYLLHYRSSNFAQTKVARMSALERDRHLTIVDLQIPTDGELGPIHALYDAQMALDAGHRAISWGFRSIVMGFNADDEGIDTEAVERIIRRVEPHFRIHTPLRDTSAADVRSALRETGATYVSCMYDLDCGWCPKCRRGR